MHPACMQQLPQTQQPLRLCSSSGKRLQQQHHSMLRARLPHDSSCSWRPHHHHCQDLSSRPRSSRRSSSSTVAAASASGLDRLADAQPLQLQPDDPGDASSAAEAAAAFAASIPPPSAWRDDAFLMACCEPGAAPLRCAVLVSGGVDSSLALQLVAAAGHQPTAFYLQIWFQEDFRNFWDACPWEEDLGYAREVCDALGVPLEVVPLTDAYWDRVVAHSVAEIAAGRTPNPDMLCNSRVKFGAFVEYLEQQHAGQFDRIVSGHYARVARQPSHHQQDHQQQQQLPVASGSSSSSTSTSTSSSGSDDGGAEVRLMMVPDAVKDQTYFLASLSPAQLARCMFPLGGFTKPQVRALACAAGLANSGRKDSQGICFLGKVKFGEFVREHLGEWPGPLVEEDSGQVAGLHDGYWFYTVGQRGGIKLPGGPWYVTRKDMATNTVFISRSYHERAPRRDAFVCGPFNWLGSERPRQQQQQQQQQAGQPASGLGSGQLLVKVRHGPATYACQLQLGSREEMLARLQQPPQQQPGGDDGIGSPTTATSSSISSSSSSSGRGQEEYGLVLLDGNDQGLAAGQYAVFYQDGQCLGSAPMLGTLAH